MKKQVIIKTTKLLICLMLIFTFIICVSIPALATEPEPDNEMTVSTTAGMQGCYMYDMETGIETYLPPLASVEHNGVLSATGDFDEDTVTPRWIIGEVDNRVIVKNPTNEKSTICLLGIRHRYPSGEEEVGTGTGWLINKNHIVTAGHCLYDDEWETSNSEDKHYAQHVAVYVGASGGKFSQYRLAKNLYAAAGYRNHNNRDNGEYNTKGKFDDWGVITLSSPVSNNSFMGLRAVNSASEMYSQYYTAGYPTDLNENQSRWDDYDMYWTNGVILGDLPQPRYLNVVRTDIDIMPGQSGSPVYARKNISDGYCAEAIVVAMPGDVMDKSNHLVLINDWLFTELTTRYS